MSLCKQRQRLNRRSECKTAVNVTVTHEKLKADEQFLSFDFEITEKNND